MVENTTFSLVRELRAPPNPEHARTHGFDPDDYLQPSDLLARLDDTWFVRINEIRPRVDPIAEGSPFTHDHVVMVQRPRGTTHEMGTSRAVRASVLTDPREPV